MVVGDPPSYWSEIFSSTAKDTKQANIYFFYLSSLHTRMFHLYDGRHHFRREEMQDRDQGKPTTINRMLVFK